MVPEDYLYYEKIYQTQIKWKEDKMNWVIISVFIAAISIGVYLISSIMIFDQLKKRHIKVSFIFLRFLIPFYAHKYKKITLNETGKVGPLFYYWIISINAALVFAAAAIAIRYI